MAGADGKMSSGDQAGDLPPPNYGAKYEQHVGTLQKQLDEAKQQCAPCSLPACHRRSSCHPAAACQQLLGGRAQTAPFCYDPWKPLKSMK